MSQKIPKSAHFFFVLVCCFFLCCGHSQACDRVLAGETFRVRLTQPVSTYSSKMGMPLAGILIESPRCNGVPVFAIGTIIQGRIRAVHRVGAGLRHETASLDLEFNRIVLDDAPPIGIRAQVVEVDNAREKVRKGTIHGVLSTETPQSLLTTRLLHLPAWNPYSYWVLMLRRALVSPYPEPEIYFLAGTDLRLELTVAVAIENLATVEPEIRDLTDAVSDSLVQAVPLLPARSFTRKHPGDVINLGLMGSPEQVKRAFQAAGWIESDSVSVGSVLRELRAVVSLSNYSRLPVSQQWVDGEAPAFSWEKSLDSYSKRDHLRIWGPLVTSQGQPLWLSGAIHETSATFSLRRWRFIHHVDANLDSERQKVVRDLIVAGCLEGVHTFARPELPHIVKTAAGDRLATDSSIAFMKLKDCEPTLFPSTAEMPQTAFRPHSRIARFMRMELLALRSDVWRANVLYVGFDLTRVVTNAIRQRRATHYEAEGQTNPGPLDAR